MGSVVATVVTAGIVVWTLVAAEKRVVCLLVGKVVPAGALVGPVVKEVGAMDMDVGKVVGPVDDVDAVDDAVADVAPALVVAGKVVGPDANVVGPVVADVGGAEAVEIVPGEPMVVALVAAVAKVADVVGGVDADVKTVAVDTTPGLEYPNLPLGPCMMRSILTLPLLKRAVP